MTGAEDIVRQDQDDVRNILALRRNQLDSHYVHHWCAAHNTRQALYDLLQELDD